MRTQINYILGSLTVMALGLVTAPGVFAAACTNTVQADVVALDQVLVFNRLGANNPISEIFALRQDVENKDTHKIESEGGTLAPGQVRHRPDKRPRPIVLRVNEGDCLQINFTNLLNPTPLSVADFDDQPATRSAGMSIMGVSYANMESSGANVGKNATSGLAAPGQSRSYTIQGDHEGTYNIYSISDNVSGEGIQGQTSFGLFGALIVEKKGSEWYRSQVTNAELTLATTGLTADNHPIINYDAVYPTGHRYAGQPILKIVGSNKIVHNELNAIITGPNHGNFPTGTYMRNPAYPNRDEAFREFTVMFHDEVETIQAFPIFTDPQFKFTLNGVKDGFMINYGSGAVGTEVVANRFGVGPTWDCPECKFEEFFLTSWAVSDPAILVDVPANTTDANGILTVGPKASKAYYPADPSNVFHAYIGDKAKIRNLHFGKEFHVFHLHAQQWLFSPDDDGGNYLDAQGIGPGSSYTYEMAYGSGNRNKEQGDAIFHCHFYPHFAQGMWALYRIHDVFEAGTQLDSNGVPLPTARALPDGEIMAGTPIPAVVPIPTKPMAPIPGLVHIEADPSGVHPGGQIVYDEPDKNAGYPFNLGMKAGHRPATPPLDIVDDGGLPRHIVRGTNNPVLPSTLDPTVTHHEETTLSFDKVLHRVGAEIVPETGNRAERAGMAFHARSTHATFLPNGNPAQFLTNGLPPAPGAPFADPCRADNGGPIGLNRIYKAAVIQFDLKMNKLGQHFPQSRILSLWGDAAATVNGTKPPEPFFIRANTNDCVTFYHTNLAPGIYEQDDFQVKTPTDIIGQHIHLVKFDVTSSDGSANGFNYEDGTMSPDEVRERIHAINAAGGLTLADGVTKQLLSAKPHPYFGSTFNGRDITGARTTIQRWYIDNLLNNKGEDRGLGNVFTHDHYGPSTHQQAGLYATLLTEPQGSKWRNPETGAFYGGRFDGGPTSWRADIITANPADSYREFMFQTADFTLAYEDGACHTVPCVNPAKAINPPGKEEIGLPFLYRKPQICPNGSPPPCPTAISAGDDGFYALNYRSEPVGHRVRNPQTNTQAMGAAGDPSLAFSSKITRANPLLNVQPAFYPPLTSNVQPGDPFTPLMQVYENDRVNVRIQVGATEESHNATIYGVKWLQEYGAPNSGYRNAQHLGISEQFLLQMPIVPDRFQVGSTADYLYSLNASNEGIWSGNWGILRSFATRQSTLLPLPNNPIAGTAYKPANEADFNGPCPKTAPVRKYDITAVAAQYALPGGALVYNSRAGSLGTGPLKDPHALLYVRTADLDDDGHLKAGVPVEPLVLRAAAGECIDVTVRNALPSVMADDPGFNGTQPFIDFFNFNQVRTSSRVGLHPQMVEYDVTRSDGSAVGNNPDQTVAPGASKRSLWYAGDIKMVGGVKVATPIEFGATGLFSPDRIKHSSRGGVGALIIEPQGSSWIEDYPTPAPTVALDQRASRASATVVKADGSTFREQVLVFQNDVSMHFGNGQPVPFVSGMEDAEDTGIKAVNYRSEPIWFRVGYNPLTVPQQTRNIDFTNSLHNSQVGGADPETPVFTTKAGDQTRLRLVYPGGHTRNHVFALFGHAWQREPYQNNSTRIGHNPKSFWRGSQDQGGPFAHWDLALDHGAGGSFQAKGDYLYRDMLPIHFLNGMWGVMRVE